MPAVALLVSFQSPTAVEFFSLSGPRMSSHGSCRSPSGELKDGD